SGSGPETSPSTTQPPVWSENPITAHGKHSFRDNCIPKCNLGTREKPPPTAQPRVVSKRKPATARDCGTGGSNSPSSLILHPSSVILPPRTPMPDLNDGETQEMKGSGAKPYLLKNTGGVYSCTCPAWRNQSIAIEKRTCKHLRRLRGDAAETARVGSA